MNSPVFMQLLRLAEQPEAVERSLDYVTAQMGRFLKKNERVLICFPWRESASCRILNQAVENCGCTPLWLKDDLRWITMLKTAFTSKCNCIVAPPLTALGLSKIAMHMGTPLFARNVLMSGYPSPSWISEAVEKGLDCTTWGCYDPGLGAVIAGFSCGQSRGVHIREEEFGVDIVDEQGQFLPMGQVGNVVVYPKSDPSVRFSTGDLGRMEDGPCSCGCTSPRLTNLDIALDEDAPLSRMGESLLYWSSILDCRLERTECGLELEVVVFQGEKLPKFPSCAKLTIRPWSAETDVPFNHLNAVKKRFMTGIGH